MKLIIIGDRRFAGVKMAHPDEFSISSTGWNNHVFFPSLQYLMSAEIVGASGTCYPYSLIGRVFCRPGVRR
jgi:hypothetical protein